MQGVLRTRLYIYTQPTYTPSLYSAMEHHDRDAHSILHGRPAGHGPLPLLTHVVCGVIIIRH